MAEHYIKVNPASQSEIYDGKVFRIGGPTDILDFATLNNTLYGFYTMRDMEIVAIECIVTEAMVCADTAGVASLTDGTKTYATVTAVDNEAANSHMSGVKTTGAGNRVVKGTMLYMKTTTQNDEAANDAGQGYFIIEYK